jgi:hypothetical protein
LATELGGYGMFDIKEMDTSIKATWISRWQREQVNPDYSGILVMGGVERDPDRLDPSVLDGGRMIVLENILLKWMEFKRSFYVMKNNVLKARLFGNSLLGEGGVNIEREVYGREANEVVNEMLDIRVGEIYEENGRLKERVELERELNLVMNWAQYFRLRGAMSRVIRSFKVDWDIREQPMKLEDFVRRQKKGCNRYRRILSGKQSRTYMENDPREIETGKRIRGIELWESRDLCELNFKVWSISHLEAEFKNFLFKFAQGRLYLNQQRARFAEVTRWCTFCEIRKRRELKNLGIEEGTRRYGDEMERLPGENEAHLFWDCQSVKTALTEVSNGIAGMINGDIDKNKFFCGWEERSRDGTLMTIICTNLLRFLIFKCKVRRRLPTSGSLRVEFDEIMNGIFKSVRWSTRRDEIVNLFRKLLNAA